MSSGSVGAIAPWEDDTQKISAKCDRHYRLGADRDSKIQISFARSPSFLHAELI
ncbi:MULTISPECIES: hypothetical protein [Kamptonema]|uniref:hypothetical protein n=1 Tax=Kamptonema TaxID=1501433 RepID=UPI00035D694B|nr:MULTISPECIES: hypothetical protein [Kamptonema]